MTKAPETRSKELCQYGLTLGYLAKIAGRSVGYVKLWSCGKAVSPHLDKVAEELITRRKSELSSAQGQ